MPFQPGDVKNRYADVTPLKINFGYSAINAIKEGVNNFIDWDIDYYKINR